MKRTLLLALLVLFAMAAGAVSATELVVNGGFENPVLGDGASAAGPGTIGGWPFYTTGTAIVNPVGDGTAEGIVVPEGSNYLRMLYDSDWAAPRTEFYSGATLKIGYKYTLSFKVGQSSDPAKTWTRGFLLWGACPNGVNFAGASIWENRYIYSSQVSAGQWTTLTYTHIVTADEAAYVGSPVGFYLNGQTWNTTDAYYFDDIKITESPVFPSSITYQGKLTNAQGEAIPDAPHDFVFKFYGEATGGQPNWTSSTMSITPTGGRFNARIENIDATAAFPNGDVWMEMVVGGETLSPRIKVNSVPFALVSGAAQ